MGTNSIGLPHGFVLDEPALPHGFVLDEPALPPGFVLDTAPPQGFAVDDAQPRPEPQGTTMKVAPRPVERKPFDAMEYASDPNMIPGQWPIPEDRAGHRRIAAAAVTAPVAAMASGGIGLTSLPTAVLPGGAEDILKNMEYVGNLPVEKLGLSEQEQEGLEALFIPFEMIHKASQVAGDAVVGWTDKLPIVKKISPELGAATATALEAGTYFLLPKYAKNKVAKVLKPGKDIATAGARVPGFDKPGVAKTEKPFNIAEPPEVFSGEIGAQAAPEAVTSTRVNELLKGLEAVDGKPDIVEPRIKHPILDRKPRKDAGARTLRGEIKAGGGINFSEFTGELANMDVGVKKISNKKGPTIDQWEQELSSMGYLLEGESLLDLLRDNPTETMRRGVLGQDVLAKRKGELTPKEQQLIDEGLEYEPESPPDGHYMEVRAVELLDGKTETMILPDGTWDTFKIKQGDFGSVFLKKLGQEPIELKWGEKVELVKPEIEAKRASLKDRIRSEEGSAEVLSKESAENLRDKVDNLEESSRSAMGAVGNAIEATKENFLSPDVVLGRDKITGPKIYRELSMADVGENAFKAKHGTEFVKVMGKTKKGSEASYRIGRALDGNADPKSLKPSERKKFSYLKKKFEFLIQRYARQQAGTKEAYQKILRSVTAKHKPRVKVTDLHPQTAELYGRMKKGLVKLRNSKKIAELPKADQKRYWEIRREMAALQEKGWMDSLTPGEAEAFDVLGRKISEYLPHIFDKDMLLTEFQNEIGTLNKRLKTATNPGAVTRYKKRLKKLEDAVLKMKAGQLVPVKNLPKNVSFRFLNPREGKAGYSFDAVRAYTTYLNGIARKMFSEPALRRIAELHKELDPSLKSYNKWLVKRFMGWEKSKLDALSGTIASFEWMRTLGLNPRSAIVNLTQRVNTVAEVGVKYSVAGEKLALSKQGKELFDQTGIAQEVPTVMMEGHVPEGLERARAVAGFFFNKVELGNRRHAFLSGYLEGKAKRMPEAQAIQYGIDVVHKTQFQYGRVGMPKIMSHPVGRLAFQFWSYPVKQMELITKWAKNDPVKLAKYLAMAEGGNKTLQEFLGIDLSNALGFGLNYGEAIEALRDVPEGDFRGMLRHTKLIFSGGGGLLPSGLGPFPSGVINVAKGVKGGYGVEALKKEVMPIAAKRVWQAYQAATNKHKKTGLYPIYNSRGHVMYRVTDKELALRTIGPRPYKESKQYQEWQADRALDKERLEVLQEIKEAIVNKNMKKAHRLAKIYKVWPSDKQIENELLKRQMTREELKAMKGFGKKDLYRIQRQGVNR